MILKNKYVFGNLLMAYEVKMLEEHLRSCSNMLKDIENTENITFLYCINFQEYLEKFIEPLEINATISQLLHQFKHEIGNAKLILEWKCSPNTVMSEYNGNTDKFYNIASFRRDLCYNWCNEVDMVLWSETDSLWPQQTLELLDGLHDHVKDVTPKYIVNFADRRLWDNSFAPIHPMFTESIFIDDQDWQFNDESSGKAYMSLERMNEINQQQSQAMVEAFTEPRFDGSCVGFSSDLLKSGCNIPHGLLHNSEDVSLGIIAKKLLGDNFIQYCFHNILHVHNRRHPHKRSFILNEDNPKGLCTAADKGDWWVELETKSKYNLDRLFKQEKFIQLNLEKSEI